jgi:hypothetical protein
MLDDARVAVVIRPLERALILLKFALVPTLALAASATAITPILDSSPATPGDWVVGVLGPALAAAYVVLLQTQTVGNRFDRGLAQFRRRIALACDHDYAASHERGGIACRLTPEVFQAPLFRYDQQRNAVNKLYSTCGEEAGGQYWFVEGESGSGKTRTALRLVQTLARDGLLFELSNHCYLYDFSVSDAVQEKLLRRLRARHHQGDIVFVDNFQLVRADVLDDLTDHLLGRAAGEERLIVFLARPREAWNLNLGSDVRMLSEAKAGNRHIVLRGPRSELVERGVSQVSVSASRLVAELDESGIASAAQLHLGQVIALNRSVPDDVLGMLQLLLGKADESQLSPDLVDVLAILTALAVHRGSFSREEFRRAVRAVEARRQSSSFYALRMHITFRRLHKIGLIAEDNHRDGAEYLFHEQLSELCSDRLSHHQAFDSARYAVGQLRLKQQQRESDALRAWLTATEIGDQQSMEECFEEALSIGANHRMTRCLRRARGRYELDPASRLQLAILLDRVGEFVESRAVLESDLESELDSSPELATLLAATRIEASHFRDYEADLGVLLESPDHLARIVGEYWEAHIAMHTGRFDSDLLVGLATEALQLLKHERGAFWQVHSLARMHFDSLRAFYLAGRSDVEAIFSPERRSLDAYLKDPLPIFGAMHTLYTQAHLVGHVLLPRMVLFNRPVSVELAATAGLETNGGLTIAGLARQALTLYHQARDQFARYGDREAIYLQADVLNAEMIQPDADLGGLREALGAYENFIVSSEFNSLNSYPHFYYLRWDVLMYYEAVAKHGQSEAADGYLSEAHFHLERIETLDGASQNRYGQLRARLLSILLRGIRDPFAERELLELKRQMAEHGYGFETELLAHLLEQRALSPAGLREVFRLYPFVHQ